MSQGQSPSEGLPKCKREGWAVIAPNGQKDESMAQKELGHVEGVIRVV